MLLEKYADVDGKTRFYDVGDVVPMDGLVRKDWREAVVDDKGRTERIPYELCVLVALRDAIRRREIYVGGGTRWRNPEDDLPGDFESAGTVHYAAIRQPEDPGGVRRRPEAADDAGPGPAVCGARGRLGGWGEGHHPQGRALDQGAEAGAAGRAHLPGGPQGRGCTAVGRARPPGCAEERRLPHRLHR
ncbi:hypothetical protein [Saccharopolyspora pogona]|uniref:hypothetical protein n=1 Tax=Saccharopolyspora pogona TaxID=333966 RepID=UPI001CC2426B|nr:hypothetical protein [Saccharopolyspora pogona]